MARVSAVDNMLGPISTDVKVRAPGEWVGKSEVIQLDEKRLCAGVVGPGVLGRLTRDP